eukprot:365718-Chlamydomonas_euryale.AAC.16
MVETLVHWKESLAAQLRVVGVIQERNGARTLLCRPDSAARLSELSGGRSGSQNAKSIQLASRSSAPNGFADRSHEVCLQGGGPAAASGGSLQPWVCFLSP